MCELLRSLRGGPSEVALELRGRDRSCSDAATVCGWTCPSADAGMSWGSISVNAAMVEPRTFARCCEEHLLTAPSGLRWPARVGRGRRRTHAGEEGLDAGRFGDADGHNTCATGARFGWPSWRAWDVAIGAHTGGERCECFRQRVHVHFSSRRFGLASLQSRLGSRSLARVPEDERQSATSRGSWGGFLWVARGVSRPYRLCTV